MIILYLALQIFYFLRKSICITLWNNVKIQNWHVIVVHYVFDVKKREREKNCYFG
jgi:hypothetical protein